MERALEQLFEGAFSHGFRGRVQPVEISRRLTRAMEDHKIVSVSQVYAPNEFDVSLNPEDYRTLSPFEAAILPELIRHMEDAAHEAGYDLLGQPIICFQGVDTVERGDIGVDARFVRREDQGARSIDLPTSALKSPESPCPSASISPEACTSLTIVDGPDVGEEYTLAGPVTSIGRGASNDVPLTDTSVSRAHAEIRQQDDGFHLVDLESKNGSFVQGVPVHDRLLSDEDRISMGATVLRFRAARVL